MTRIVLSLLPPFLLATAGQSLQAWHVDQLTAATGGWGVDGAPDTVFYLGLLKAACVLAAMTWAAMRLTRVLDTPHREHPLRDMFMAVRFTRADLIAHGGMLLSAAALIPLHITTVGKLKQAGLDPLWVLADGVVVATIAVSMGTMLWLGIRERGRTRQAPAAA